MRGWLANMAGQKIAGLQVLLGILWLASVPVLQAQAASESADWVLDSWPTDAGLPHNTVSCILETQDSYLWIGTPAGLARFDGVRFATFRVADGLGLRDNRILCLHEDAQGVLWVGTEAGGLARFHQGQFTSLTREEGLASDTVLCLGEGPVGDLWVGTDSGLTQWLNRRPVSFFKTDGLPDDRVNTISQPRGSGLIFSTANGLCRFGRENLEELEVALPAPARSNLTCLRFDQAGRLWLGGSGGLFRLPARESAAPATSPVKITGAPVTALIERRNGEIWFGTALGELYRAGVRDDASAGECLWRAGQPITTLCEDSEGNVWVGTDGTGLHRLKPRQLRLIPLPETGSANGSPCFFETPQGGLRLVAQDKRLYQHRDRGLEPLGRLLLPDGVVIQAVCQARTGEYWVGTLRDGLFRCGPDGLRQFSERDGLSDSAIEVLRADEDGGLWIGTRNGGLNYFKDGTVIRFNTPWGFFGACACTLERDAHGQLWIGTTGEGLFRLHEDRFDGFTTDTGLPNNHIHALQADADGALWIGTEKGLCRLKDGNITVFTSGSGLYDEPILQLRSDDEAHLWAGTANRILRVSKAQLNAFADGHARGVNVVTYGKEDGLPGIQCLPRVQPQDWPDGSDRIWFATTKGLVMVEHAVRPWNTRPCPVILENVWVDNVSVPFTDGVRVAPGKESLRFEFTGLSLTAPGKVNFRYQLKGFDRDWSEAGPTRAARYPKVPPGRYRFQVSACNNDGLWNETGASVAVTVIPFWWATLWFQIGVVLTVVGTLASLYWLRRARRREIERLRLRIASDLHDDVGSSLWSITLLSRMLAKHGQLGEEEQHDVNEIHRIAVQTSNSIRDIIWLINPAFDTVQDWMLRTKDFAATILRGVDYRMHCEGADLARKLPFDFRHNLFLLVKEALTNIARHAQATTVDIRIEEFRDFWRLTIQDNGVGFDPSVSTGGNGLRNLRARAAKMGANLEIHSQPGQGTTIILTTTPP